MRLFLGYLDPQASTLPSSQWLLLCNSNGSGVAAIIFSPPPPPTRRAAASLKIWAYRSSSSAKSRNSIEMSGPET